MWALIPLKDFVQAKQRLSGILNVSERRCLFQAMVEDLLDVLTQVDAVERIILLSDDPVASLLAEHYGIDCWSEKSLGGYDLNSTINAAIDAVTGLVDTVLVAHGDLPLATVDEWQQVIQVHRQMLNQEKLTIVTDRQCDGSNVVLCSPPGALYFEYGPESCHHHRAQAKAKPMIFEVLELQGLSRDVDDADDLAELLSRDWGKRACRTFKYLRDNGLDQRIKAQVAGEANSAFIRRELAKS